MIPWGSLKHLFYSLVSEAVLFDAENCNDISHGFKRRSGLNEYKIFLQHGVIVSFIPGYVYSETTFDLVICSNRQELKYLKTIYKYPGSCIALAGLARHDDLIKNRKDKRFIFVAPTWRKNLEKLSEAEFVRTEYFLRWNSLLSEINEFAKEKGLKVGFRLHYMFDRFHSVFTGWEDNAYRDTDSIHEMIRDCSILITDYSSVSIDAALIRKPVLYYQFDYSDYRKYHQSEGYFDYSRDGFGDVAVNEDVLMDKLRELWTGDSFTERKEYWDRSGAFFEYHDMNNCQRNYDAVREYIGKYSPRPV